MRSARKSSPTTRTTSHEQSKRNEGRLTREVVTEVSEDTTARCTCGGASIYSGYCMVHGYVQRQWPPYTVTCNTPSSSVMAIGGKRA